MCAKVLGQLTSKVKLLEDPGRTPPKHRDFSHVTSRKDNDHKTEDTEFLLFLQTKVTTQNGSQGSRSETAHTPGAWSGTAGVPSRSPRGWPVAVDVGPWFDDVTLLVRHSYHQRPWVHRDPETTDVLLDGGHGSRLTEVPSPE